MNKIALFLLTALQLSAVEVLTEGRIGYFLPTNEQFKETYGEDGMIGSIESSFKATDRLYPWANISYYANSGHAGEDHKKTHIYFLPIGAGLKYIYPFENFSVYGGLGVLPTYLHIKNNSHFLVREQAKWGCGGVAKFGFLSNKIWNFFLDLFAEYSYINIHFHKKGKLAINPAILSNFTFGGGIGYHFGCKGCKDENND